MRDTPETAQEAQKEAERYKDRECITCEGLFDCKGKIRGVKLIAGCIKYKERK